jgi:molybdopterin-biosynthesis enzyme MoeA-like protein
MLYARGVDLVRIEVVPDDREDIARSVAALSERVGPDGFVFTSGGIGVRSHCVLRCILLRCEYPR